MGIIKVLVEFFAGDAIIEATDVAIKGIDKATESLEKKAEERLQKFIESTPGHSHLFVSQIRYRYKETYYIYDYQKNVVFVVKGELLSKKHHLHIYDATGHKKLGMVKEKLVAFRSPFSMESKPKDFVIYADGKKLGKVKTKASFAKTKFVVTFNDWYVEGDVFGKNYKILDRDKNIIMTASQKLSYTTDMYFVDVTNPNDDFFAILVLLALDSASTSKSEERKRARKHRRLL